MKNLFSNIKGDAFGGITAGIVALPLALAFGVSSGLGPSAGLYGAIFLSFFAEMITTTIAFNILGRGHLGGTRAPNYMMSKLNWFATIIS